MNRSTQEGWESVFEQKASSRANEFLWSQGITTFDFLSRGVDQLSNEVPEDESVLSGWLEVAKTLGQVSQLEGGRNEQCRDLAESILRALYENQRAWALIGAKEGSQLLFEWAYHLVLGENTDRAVALIVEAARLDPENLTYDFWYAGTFRRGAIELPVSLSAIRSKLEMFETPWSNPKLRAQKHIELGSASGQALHFHTALVLLGRWGNRNLRARALIGLGDARDGNEVEHYWEALELARSTGNQSVQAQALIGLGNARDENEIEHYRNALELARMIGKPDLQARALIGLGNARDGDRVERYREALELAQRTGNQSVQAQALIGLGNARDGNEVEHYREALELGGRTGNQSVQAQALIGLGNARDGDQAPHYHAALKLARRIGNQNLQVQALIGLGNAGDGDQASHYHAALKLARRIGNQSLQVQALIGLGNARDGNEVEHYQEALELAQSMGNQTLQAQALIGLGNARDGNEVEHYQEALELAQSMGNQTLQAQALIGLGNARDENEVEHYQEAFELAQSMGNQTLQAQALIGLGNVARSQGDMSLAYRYFQQTLGLSISPTLRQRAEKGLRESLPKQEGDVSSAEERLRVDLYMACTQLSQQVQNLELEIDVSMSTDSDAAGYCFEDRSTVEERLSVAKVATNRLRAEISATLSVLKQRAGVSDRTETETGLPRAREEAETDRDLCWECGVEPEIIDQLIRNPFARVEDKLNRALKPHRGLSNGR
jgi:hypothetical protein